MTGHSLQPIPILFHYKDWLVVDKPHGLSIHNNEDPDNLVKVLSSQLSLESLFPVHRLDKETSGVQVFALNKESAQTLSGEFQAHRVQKTYWGLVKGVLKVKKGLWDKPLTDKAEGRKSPQGLARNRVPCATEYKVIQESSYLSLCEFRLLTGRQHQIRKHCALINHPLVGDARYGSQALNMKIKQIYQNDRMYLHCMEMVLAGHKLESKTIPEFNIFFKDLIKNDD